MSKPVIAVDVDEVLAHHNVELVKYHNQVYGSKHTLEHYVSDHWSEIWNVEKEESRKRAIAFHETGIHGRLQPINGAYESLKELSESFEFHVVTARRRLIIESTNEWINTHYPGIFKSINFVHIWEDANPPTKAEVCRELGALLLIDDSVGHCALATESGIDAILFGDYPWNNKLPTDFPKEVKRAANWEQVSDYIKGTYSVGL